MELLGLIILGVVGLIVVGVVNYSLFEMIYQLYKTQIQMQDRLDRLEFILNSDLTRGACK